MMLPWNLHVLRLKIAAALAWILLGFVFTLLFAAVLPMAFGMHTHTVRSGSMSPSVETGDVIISSSISPTKAEVGDIVTFDDPQGGGHLISHRVRAVQPEGDRVKFVTRGDANNNSENWDVAAAGNIGRIAYRVPMLGRAMTPISGGLGRIGLVVIPALLLCALGLIRIWRPDELGVQEALPPILPVRRLSPAQPPSSGPATPSFARDSTDVPYRVRS